MCWGVMSTVLMTVKFWSTDSLVMSMWSWEKLSTADANLPYLIISLALLQARTSRSYLYSTVYCILYVIYATLTNKTNRNPLSFIHKMYECMSGSVIQLSKSCFLSYYVSGNAMILCRAGHRVNWVDIEWI